MSQKWLAVCLGVIALAILFLWRGPETTDRMAAPTQVEAPDRPGGREPHPVLRPRPLGADPAAEGTSAATRTGFQLQVDVEPSAATAIRLVGVVETADGGLVPVAEVRNVTPGTNEVACDVPCGGRLHLELAWADELLPVTPPGGMSLPQGAVTRLPAIRVGAATIHGRVVDRATRRGVAGTDITLHLRPDASAVRTSASSHGGKFRIDPPAGAGPWLLRVRPPARYEAPQDLAIRELSLEEHTIELQPLAELRVTPMWRGHPLSGSGLVGYFSPEGAARMVLRAEPPGTFWAPQERGVLSTWYEQGQLRCRLEDAFVDARSTARVDLRLECLPPDRVGFLEVVARGGFGAPAPQILRIRGPAGAASTELVRIPLDLGRALVPLGVGTYLVQAASIGVNEARVSGVMSVEVRSHELARVDALLAPTARVLLVLPSAGASTLRLGSSAGIEEAWLNATFSGRHAEFVEPAEVGRFGTARIEIFLTPGTWAGSLAWGSETRSLEIVAAAGMEQTISPWE